MVLRVIPTRVRTIDELGLPPVLKRIAEEERGLVLVTGTTGSGKSTTLAAMIDHVNSTRAAHIMTVEDPIEYLHRDYQSIVSQREVAVDTASFSQALRSALRQDPDVILVGEMRDFETVETALLAAETGHLVFSTLHTLDATETISRIISVFPPHQQRQIRIQLSTVLKAAVSQRLMPRADGLGRVPAVEVMIAHALHPRLHRRQGSDEPDPRRDRVRHVAVRDADVRPVDLRPLSAGVRDAGRSPCAGRRTSTSSSSRSRASRPPRSWRVTKWPSRAASSRTSSGLGADSRPSAYLDALHLLSRRALLVAECRDRLLAREHPEDKVDAAIARLLETGSLDDKRLAQAHARTAVDIKGRGRLRVIRELQARGVDKEVAAEAVGEVFGEKDERALVARALQKKLRTRTRPADAAEHARLYQYLMRQGFTPAVVVEALRRLRRSNDGEVE